MLRTGIVVETHPQDNSVDIVMADDGARLVGVQLVSLDGSSRTGTVGMPKITPKGKDKWDITQPTGQDMKAIVGFVGRNPVVMGFLYPQINQMTLTDPLARRTRHQSDVETLIDGDGNTQLTMPNGTFVRIGEQREKDTLSGKVADTSATDRNTGKRYNIHIEQAGGVAKINIDPDGNIEIEHDGFLKVDTKKYFKDAIGEYSDVDISEFSKVNIGENLDVTVGTTTTIVSGTSATISAPFTYIRSPNILLDGHVHVTKDVQVDEGIHANMDIVSSADVLASEGIVSLINHQHVDSMPGSGKTGKPG